MSRPSLPETRCLLIIAVLAENGGTATVSEIATDLGRKPRRIWRDLETLIDARRVMQVTGGSVPVERIRVRLATSAERGLILLAQRTAEVPR